MKSLVIAFCLAAFSGAALANHSHHQETRTAEQLVGSLEQLASQARQEENYARRSGDPSLLRDLTDVRSTAENLAYAVESRVLWLLYGRNGQGNIAGARREFQNQRIQFERLSRINRTSRFLPYSISRLIDIVEYHQDQLAWELNNCRDDYNPRPIPGPGPRPIPGPVANWECTARDAGWEEHPGAHKGYGRDQRSAQFEALSQCERLHGQCYITSCVQR